MGANVEILYPNSLALSLKMDDREFRDEMKTLSLVKLYELGKVSSGTASEILNMRRIDFLELLGKYKVSFLQPADDLDIISDLQNA